MALGTRWYVKQLVQMFLERDVWFTAKKSGKDHYTRSSLIRAKGGFTNHVGQILPIIDHQSTPVYIG